MRTVVVLAAMAGLALLGPVRPAQAQAEVEWTVMVYLNGDNAPGQASLENASISDFNEMEQIGSTANMNVVVQWDRAEQTDNLDQFYPGDPTQSWTTTRRYLVTRDTRQLAGSDPDALEPDTAANPPVVPAGYTISTPVLLDIGEANMGSGDTLVEFFRWTIQRFPARHYMLVLNDTGRGWQPRSRAAGTRGLIFDASVTGDAGDTNPAVYVTNDELRTALQQIKQLNGNEALDLLALDAGGQGALSVIYQIRDLADFVIAHVLERPTDGFPYDLWLNRLSQVLPRDRNALVTMASNMAAESNGSYAAGSNNLGGARTTVTGVYDMLLVEQVAQAVHDLAALLLTDMPQYAPAIFRALALTQYGRTTDYTSNYLDLQDFVTRLAAELPNEVAIVTQANLVADLVSQFVANESSIQQSIPGDLDATRFSGLSAYFPRESEDFDATYAFATDLADNTLWDELVQGLLTQFSDTNPPAITITAPSVGSTVIQNPPEIVAVVTDPDTGGRINTATLQLAVDGQAVPAGDFSFDPDTGVLRYQIPNPLTATSHTFTITAEDLSGNRTVATGNFRVAVPTLQAGIQTFSLPRRLTSADADPSRVFGPDNFTMARWVPFLFGVDKYRLYPDPYASLLPPDAAATLNQPTVPQPPAGLGYWIRLRDQRPLPSLPGQPVTLNSYPIRLYTNPDGGAGWNMIGNPYDLPAVSLASATVLLPDGERLTMRQAINRRITPGVLYTYEPNSSNPNAGGRYTFDAAGEGQLIRMQGHWLKANEPFTLIVESGAATRTQPADGWQLELQVAQEGASGAVAVGRSAGTSEGYDPRWDVAAPPRIPGGIGVSVVHSDWGADNGRYLTDYRSAAGETGWEIEIDAPAGELVVSWPQLRGLPADVEPVLTDPVSGQQRNLRVTSAYRFQHGGGSRILQLRAGRRESGGLGISSLTVTPGRGSGYRVGYTLTRSAQVQLVVRGLNGGALDTVSASGSAGRGELFWDARAADGTPLPNGIYRLEVVAVAPDGSTARQMRVVRVLR